MRDILASSKSFYDGSISVELVLFYDPAKKCYVTANRYENEYIESESCFTSLATAGQDFGDRLQALLEGK